MVLAPATTVGDSQAASRDAAGDSAALMVWDSPARRGFPEAKPLARMAWRFIVCGRVVPGDGATEELSPMAMRARQPS